MNMGLRILLLHLIMIGCASTPKPVAKKKAGPAASAAKTSKNPAVSKTPAKPGPAAEEETVEEEEEDDQFSRIKKYYKK